jgi:hypothetical protein
MLRLTSIAHAKNQKLAKILISSCFLKPLRKGDIYTTTAGNSPEREDRGNTWRGSSSLTAKTTMATTPSQRSEDVLCSDADGVYDISFFSASVGHSADTSKRVFNKFSGAMLSTFADDWRRAKASERRAFLLEHHEMAHHVLMFSTPVGVLNWRINQVASRDIVWILQKCREYDVTIPDLRKPASFLNGAAWKKEFLPRSDDIPQTEKRHLVDVIESLERLLLLRSIIFDKGAVEKHHQLTFGAMIDLMNECYRYLGVRCDCAFVTAWKTRLPAETKVFPNGKCFNVTDIAECHAISDELFVLRALSDTNGLAKRADEARDGPFGRAVALAMDQTKGANDLGYSPHQMQIMALLSCCTAVESRSKEEQAVEGILKMSFRGGAFHRQTYSRLDL